MPYPHEQDWIPSYKDEWPWGGDPNKKFKGVQLNSEAHVSLCKELAKEGFTFSFEAFTFVPHLQQVVGCHHARIDLVVYYSDKYLMVEIDGQGHFPGGYTLDHIAEAKDNTN